MNKDFESWKSWLKLEFQNIDELECYLGNHDFEYWKKLPGGSSNRAKTRLLWKEWYKEINYEIY